MSFTWRNDLTLNSKSLASELFIQLIENIAWHDEQERLILRRRQCHL